MRHHLVAEKAADMILGKAALQARGTVWFTQS